MLGGGVRHPGQVALQLCTYLSMLAGDVEGRRARPNRGARVLTEGAEPATTEGRTPPAYPGENR